MHKNHFKPVAILEAIFKKIASGLFLVLLLFNLLLLSGKNNEVNTDTVQIIISNDAIVYDTSVFETAKEKQPLQGEIFVTEETQFYITEPLENVKITKLVSGKKESSLQKISSVKKEVKKKNKETFKQKSAIVFLNKSNTSGAFSQNENEKLVFSQNRTEYFSKAIISSAVYLLGKNHGKETKQTITYQNPSITISYFSGKYLVRPPTYFS